MDSKIKLGFLVLTFIIIVAIVLMSPDRTTALLNVGLVTNFLIISAYLSKMHGDLSLDWVVPDASAAIAHFTDPDPPKRQFAERAPGHYYARAEGEVPPFGNPYELNNLDGPVVDGALEFRDNLGGSEKNALQVSSRNDPYRVAAGRMRQKDLMTKYVKEELDEEEDSYWWGNWEL